MALIRLVMLTLLVEVTDMGCTIFTPELGLPMVAPGKIRRGIAVRCGCILKADMDSIVSIKWDRHPVEKEDYLVSSSPSSVHS